ncbi:MAG: alpha/beta hydrolase [Candidatus Liptonbacteria bacterium]|nr:alpha/beta hydrolase [Candidatus Liptonbacteria bacterium]
MKKRVFIIHGWDGYPKEGWFPWVKKELEKKRKFDVKVPAMPSPSHPKLHRWVAHLRKLVGRPDTHTYFVGHSMGCRAILRYLEKLPPKAKVGGAVLVAGWVSLTPLATGTKEEKEIAGQWLKTRHNFARARSHTKSFTAIFSDNDKFVPRGNWKVYRKKLGAKIIIQRNKGHFSGSDGIKKLPAALEAILKISKN